MGGSRDNSASATRRFSVASSFAVVQNVASPLDVADVVLSASMYNTDSTTLHSSELRVNTTVRAT